MSENSSAKANRRAEAEKELRERKKYNTIVMVTVAVLAVLVIFVVLFSSNLFYNTTTAVDINGVNFTVADFNYNYFSAYNTHYNQYYMYAQLGYSGVLPVAGTPFDRQVFATDENGKEITWADYFESQALSTMEQIAMLITEAEKAGYTLSKDELDAINESVEGMRTTATLYGYPNLDSYLVQMYGKGMTEKVFRKNLERQALAASYLQHKRDSFTYTAEQLTSHYAEHKDEYDYITYRSYKLSGAAVKDDPKTDEDETLSLDDAMAKAEADAKAFEEAVKSEQDYLDYAASLNEDNEKYDADAATLYAAQGANVKSSVLEDIYNWLIDPARKAGDVTVIGTAKDATAPGFYVIYFVEREDNQYKSANGWYGFIPENKDVFGEDEAPEDEDTKAQAIKDVNLATAQEVLVGFINGADHSVEAFSKVMDSSANEKLVTTTAEILKLGRYDGPEDVCEWLLDPARKAGDVETIYVEGSGTYLLYFSGLDDVYADLIADSAMRTDATNSWIEEAMAPYTAHKQWEMILSKKMASLN